MTRYLPFLFVALLLCAPFLMPYLGWLGLNCFIAFCLLAFAFAHGSHRYGILRLLGFVLSGFVVATLLEALSIRTGFPFGLYTHMPIMGPRLFSVPLVTGLIYPALAYTAWRVADTIVNRSLGGLEDRRILTSVVAGFIMAGCDAGGDAAGATIMKAWIYPHGGGFFGVPLSNFVGWIVTGFATTLAGTRFLRDRGPQGQGAMWFVQPPALLLAFAAQPILALSAPDLIVEDAAGHVWHSSDIFESAVIVAMLTSLYSALLALMIVLKDRSQLSDRDKA